MYKKAWCTCKVVILPILNNWFFAVLVQILSWDSSEIEKTHLQFCKRYLQVHNKASNITCRAELGKFPMNFDNGWKDAKLSTY